MSVTFDSAYVYGLTGLGKKVKLGQMRLTIPDAQPLGGKIFHIEDSDNGASYTFLDEHGRIVYPESTVDSSGIEHLNEDCASAYAYIKTGTSSADKYYVVGIGGDDSMGLSSLLHWTYFDEENSSWKFEYVGTKSGFGKGKTNTALVMEKDNGAYIKSAGGSQQNDTIWKFIFDVNNANANGNSDWFLGSNEEQDKLINVRDSDGNKLVTWYDANYMIFTSCEYRNSEINNEVSCWRPWAQEWYEGFLKSAAHHICCMRAF